MTREQLSASGGTTVELFVRQTIGQYCWKRKVGKASTTSFYLFLHSPSWPSWYCLYTHR